MKRNRIMIPLVLISVLVMVGVGYKFLGDTESSQGSFAPFGIPLVKPAIAQSEASFLDDEAGMSAYVNVPIPINLNNARNAFRTVEMETTEWIIGSVEITGHPEAEDAHVFVHKDGWIVSYYERGSPVGRVVHWNSHPNPGAHKLEQALTTVAANAGVPVQNIGYFNFEFPNATEWLLVFDNDSFSLNIPSQFLVFERSYSFFVTDANDCGSTPDFSRLQIDGVTIDSRGCNVNGTFYNHISATTLSVDVPHGVGFSRDGTTTSVAISILYLPPSLP